MNFKKMRTEELYSLEHTLAGTLLKMLEYPWEALPLIHDYVLTLGESLPEELYEKRGEDVWIARNAIVAPTASITGPTIIGEYAEIRHCAFLRGSILIGKEAVVGNSTELKNSILFDKVQVPHYNYVGDSILGYASHMGAGSITSNVKSDKGLVTIKVPGGRVETGLKKFGAMLGDRVEVGCGTVLNPGSVVGKGSHIYPLSMVRGYVQADSIYKNEGEVAVRGHKDES